MSVVTRAGPNSGGNMENSAPIAEAVPRARRRFILKAAGGHRRRMSILMLIADLLGFVLAAAGFYLLNLAWRLFVFNPADLKYAIILLSCLIFFMNSKLYPGVGINPADEIKLVTQNMSLGFAVGVVFFIIIQGHWRPNMAAFALVWGLSLPMVIFTRWGVRIVAAQLGLWGEPVVMIGSGASLDGLTRYFLLRRRLGFVPVLAAAPAIDIRSFTSSVPLMDIQTMAAQDEYYFMSRDIQTALVEFSLQDGFKAELISGLRRLFRNLIFVSDMDLLESASIATHDFEGLLGLEFKEKGLSRLDASLKRLMDIGLTLALGLLFLPFSIFFVLAIRLDSPGPIFYSQERLGRGGRKFRIYKFRTMIVDADKFLVEYLAQHRQARLGWKQTQKLKDDPRITRVGRWLRSFSLDELPQLFNVLKGEMSLIGPRPMMLDQHAPYGKFIDLYFSVRPGLSGMWQVSGRNQTSFEERARFDAYYVHNWSVWLDIYILLRTVWVVLNRDGAY